MKLTPPDFHGHLKWQKERAWSTQMLGRGKRWVIYADLGSDFERSWVGGKEGVLKVSRPNSLPTT